MPPQGKKPVATRLRENLAYLRSVGASRDEIDAEIARAKEAMDRVSASERKLSGAEKAAAVGSKMAAGLTFGGFDELASVVGGKDEQRYLQKQLEEENPKLAMGAEVAGGLAMPFSFLKAPAAAVKAGRALHRAKQAGTVLGEGAIQGGLSGLGSAEGSLEDRIASAGKGMAAGAVTSGLIAGGVRGVGAIRRGAAKGAGVHAPSLEELVDGVDVPTIQKWQRRYGELGARGLHDKAFFADVIDNGEGYLRSARTANKEVAKGIDTKLRERSTQLADEADDRLSDYTGTQRRSTRKTQQDLIEEAQREAKPFYEASEVDAFGREPIVETVPKIETAAAPKPTLREALKDFEERRSLAVQRRQGTPSQQSARETLERHALEMERPPIRGESKPREMVRTESGRPPLSDNVLSQIRSASELPSVAAATKRVQRSPRYANLPPTDHRVMDQVYKEIGEDIRVLRDKRSAKTISTQERRELADLVEERNTLKAAMVARSKFYGEALDKYADPMGRLDAYKRGAANTPADVVPSEMAELAGDAGELASYKEGGTSRLRANLPNADLGAYAKFSDVLAPVANREKKELFIALHGEKKYREYLADVLEMAKMQKLRAGAGESTTADKVIEMIQAGGNSDLGEIAMSLATGNVPGALRRGVTALATGSGLSRLLTSQKNAQGLADLMTKSGQDIPMTLDEMIRLKQSRSQSSRPALVRSQTGRQRWVPTVDAVKNTAARTAGAATGRERR